jgi:hypothetical protein
MDPLHAPQSYARCPHLTGATLTQLVAPVAFVLLALCVSDATSAPPRIQPRLLSQQWAMNEHAVAWGGVPPVGVDLSSHTGKSSLGDAESSLGDTESSLGDTESSLGDARSSLGDAESSLGDAKSSLGDAESSLGDAKSSLGDV